MMPTTADTEQQIIRSQELQSLCYKKYIITYSFCFCIHQMNRVNSHNGCAIMKINDSTINNTLGIIIITITIAITITIIIIIIIIIYFWPSVNIIPREFKNWVQMRKWVRSSISAVNGWQTVVQQDSIEALHQYRDPLVQVAGLSSLARVEWNPPSKIIKEVVGWCVEFAQGLYHDWFKDVVGTKVNILLLFIIIIMFPSLTQLLCNRNRIWLVASPAPTIPKSSLLVTLWVN